MQSDNFGTVVPRNFIEIHLTQLTILNTFFIERGLRKNGSIRALRHVNKPILSFRKSNNCSKDILTTLETFLKKIH